MNRIEVLPDDDEDDEHELQKTQNAPTKPQPQRQQSPAAAAPTAVAATSGVATADASSDVGQQSAQQQQEQQQQPVAPPVVDEAVAAEALSRANARKAEGNERFAAEELRRLCGPFVVPLTCRLRSYEEALRLYGEALEASAMLEGRKERAVFFANRAACLMALNRAPEAIEDCSAALKLDDRYVKVYVRRAQAYEKTDKLPEALADYKKASELDGTVAVAKDGVRCVAGIGSSWSTQPPTGWVALSLRLCVANLAQRLEPIVKEIQEKQMAEMMGQLKGFGNTLLGKLGLSLDNFKLEQDPATGSYSVQFVQGGK